MYIIFVCRYVSCDVCIHYIIYNISIHVGVKQRGTLMSFVPEPYILYIVFYNVFVVPCYNRISHGEIAVIPEPAVGAKTLL